MQQTLYDAAITRIVGSSERPIDQSLPEWARRSNPIVRRHLREYWKTTPIEFNSTIKALIAQLGLILLTFPFPFLFSFIMPTVTVSLVMLPIALYIHATMLYYVGKQAADWVAEERINESIDLLRVSPRPLTEILASKIAAGVWRQAENLSLLIFGGALFSLPLLIIQYDGFFPVDENPILVRLGMALAMFVCVIRIPLEAAMAGAIGAVSGAFSRWKAAAEITTHIMVIAYFIMLNGLRLVAWEPIPRLIVEIVLPIALPLLITTVCLRIAASGLSRG